MTQPDAFNALVSALAMGIRIPQSEQQRILSQTGKSQEDIATALPGGRPACPGDPCKCGGRLVVVNSVPHGRHRVQYLGCPKCSYRPQQNKRTVPEQTIRRRLPNAKQPVVSTPGAEADNRVSEDSSCEPA